MKKDTVVSLKKPGEHSDTLTGLFKDDCFVAIQNTD